MARVAPQFRCPQLTTWQWRERSSSERLIVFCSADWAIGDCNLSWRDGWSASVDALHRRGPSAIAQFVNVPHCEAMRSAPRCDKAKMVKVGFEAPSVGKIPGPATQRFGIS